MPSPESCFYGHNHTCKRCQKITQMAKRRGITHQEAEERYEFLRYKERLPADGMRWCPRCKSAKSLNDFPRYWNAYCSTCRAEWTHTNYKKLRAKDFTVGIYQSAKGRAAGMGFPFDLTRASVRQLYDSQGGRCALTGLEMTTDGNRGAFTASLDRIVPARGYTQGNVRWVCLMVNCALNEWGEGPFAEVARGYVAHQLTLKS